MLTLPVAGYEKITLNDYSGKIACTLFTSGCNLRCRYCHNRDLVLNTVPLIDLKSVVDGIVNVEIKNIVITGGEPLINKGLKDFLHFLKGNGLNVKLDTNGTLPDKLNPILVSGLVNYVAMDLKGFDDDDLKYITRIDVSIDKVVETARMLDESGTDFELRYTVWHNDIEKIKRFLKKVRFSNKPKLYLQNFRHTHSNLDKTFVVYFTEKDLLKMKTELMDLADIHIRGLF